jgi:hypothetical protein
VGEHPADQRLREGEEKSLEFALAQVAMTAPSLFVSPCWLECEALGAFILPLAASFRLPSVAISFSRRDNGRSKLI